MHKTAFAACLLLSGISVCGTAKAQSCTAPELLNTITMEPVAGSDLMTVPITINGKQKQFLLDTGDATTQVSEVMVRDLGLPEHTYMGGARELNVRGSHKADDARERVQVAEFVMGSQKGSGFQFLVAEDRELGRGKPYDGLLANDLFNNYDVDMDFGTRQLKYFGSSHCAGQVVYWPQRPVAVVPVTLMDRKIYVPVTSGRPSDQRGDRHIRRPHHPAPRYRRCRSQSPGRHAGHDAGGRHAGRPQYAGLRPYHPASVVRGRRRAKSGGAGSDQFHGPQPR